MKKQFLSLFLLLLAPASLFAQTVEQDASIRQGKLKNGLTYYIRHNAKEAGLAAGIERMFAGEHLNNTEDRSVFIRRQYPGQDLQESIELDLGQLAEVEAMLLNSRLWLERATKQAAELKAAEEIATDAEDGPEVLVCFLCGHPFHGLKVCDDCGCPRPSMGGS